ncbi:hypothetical protein J4732_19560 [Serratia marcescens]|uniref:Uncharacterized protein n=1 Tax=Serratia marcescens TaxID=615 RepID=A0A939STR7_SERMA|nr:hypothetical protein [Serratia marcescens]
MIVTVLGVPRVSEINQLRRAVAPALTVFPRQRINHNYALYGDMSARVPRASEINRYVQKWLEERECPRASETIFIGLCAKTIIHQWLNTGGI